MKPLRGVFWASALMLLGAGAQPGQAAWNNVFQVCCNSCGHSSASSYGVPSYGTSNYGISYYAADPGCNTCPQQTCTTHYEQRCYYQPVTTYQTKTYYEPVTTYRTSYYYEPVTSYRYSCYYDPCTCSYQQVACPTTSYRLRSQCCPVQSWTQRCCQVPVTSYQQAFYYEPVTSCCTTPAPSCCPTGYSAAASPETTPQPQYQAGCAPTAPPNPAPSNPPAVSEQTTPNTPGVRENPGTGGSNPSYYERQYPTPQIPPAQTGIYRQTPPRLPVVPPKPVPAASPPPQVHLDRIVTGPVSQVQGQVVRQDSSPHSGARLLFISTAQQGPRETVTADGSGQFRVTLASGGWLVYVNEADHNLMFHSKIEIRDNETQRLTLVSR
ncbi:MAG: hypothetical protein JO112_12440 [Planctomycetes bacterium]|nr:hypothetical protein [Planctomycetota bacterium]